ncbi:MAG: hypothetical protein JNN21_07265 [Candidatus Accumulibacter sp.]|uniref:hypothetical protein n=1 Tax=Accumulibacter sp. TaxID=2053492 RepID=UPI001A61B7CA|nr:hypothetical protein [Accumulibacter sp.]MBL8391658.1 hypothetical protein [Accumulibacter sp.]HRD90702.1 hypothetical protein [Accumulibacter sp.]
MAAGIAVPQVYRTPLEEWFLQVNHQISRSSSVDGALATGAEVKTGLPLVGSLLARLTTAIRSNSTWKTEIREQVRNSFTDLARSFNQLLSFVEDELRRQGRARARIFVVDGTDCLCGDEAQAFFIRDIQQLRRLRANSIYCAPITVLDEQGAGGQNFDAVERLPMLKPADKGSAKRNEIAWQRLREFVHKRLPVEDFDHETTLDDLIAHSGGHPRDLLRLLNLCFQEIDEGPITQAVAATAARRHRPRATGAYTGHRTDAAPAQRLGPPRIQQLLVADASGGAGAGRLPQRGASRRRRCR